MKKPSNNFLLLLLVLILILGYLIIRDYLIAILLAAITAGLLYPTYLWFEKKFKGKSSLASVMVVGLFLLLIIIPSLFFIGLIVEQAVQVSDLFAPYVQEQIQNASTEEFSIPDWIPFADRLEPYQSQIMSKIGEYTGQVGELLVNNVSALTQGTFSFFLQLFIMSYAIFFFLRDGAATRSKAKQYFPLKAGQFDQLLDRSLSITRATVKGAFFIGLVQGFSLTLAFWVIGIQGAVFWGAIVAVLSVIPSVGAAIVWVPAAIYLFFDGQSGAAIGLALWGAIFIGNIDNVIRPSLVGKDTEMPDLLILVSTLGGISFFGIIGFILGPIICGLLMTIADMYFLPTPKKVLEEE